LNVVRPAQIADAICQHWSDRHEVSGFTWLVFKAAQENDTVALKLLTGLPVSWHYWLWQLRDNWT
jgi:hypothetical protein